MILNLLATEQQPDLQIGDSANVGNCKCKSKFALAAVPSRSTAEISFSLIAIKHMIPQRICRDKDGNEYPCP